MDTKILRQKILDLAIHGRLVKQDANDEPASTLLARIRQEKEQLVKDGKLKKKDLVTTPVSDEDKPFEVPKGWEWCRLGEICKIQSSKRIHKQDYVPSGVPFYRTTEIKELSEGNPISNCLYIKEEQYKIIKDNFGVPQKGDTLISAVGTIGITYTIQDNTPFYFKDGNLIWISKSSAIVSIFLCEILGYLVRDKGAISTSGSAYNALTIEKLNSYLIPLPPLAEQQRIVAAVEQWMSLVDIIESGKENLQQSIALAKNKILDLAIKGKLVEKEGEWEEKTLGEIFQHNTGKALNKSAGQEGKLLPYITTSNLYWDHFELENVKSMYFKDSEIEKCTVKKGDLLVCEGGDIGRSAIWNFDYDICIQNHIHRLRPIIEASPKFYYFVLMYYKMTNNIEGKGIGMMGLSSKQLDKIILPLPPLSEQQRIVAKIEELFAQLDIISNALK